MSGASEYALRKFIKIGNVQIDVLRKQFWFKRLGLPYFLILIIDKNGMTCVRGFKVFSQPKIKERA